MKVNLLSAALITAALLTTPAMARESQVISQRSLTANANAHIPTGARSTDGQACCRNRARDLPSLADRDAWSHWGAYYGPMVNAP
jgi:hypothetical protein